MSNKKPKATRKRMISCFAPLLSHRPPPTTIQGTLPSFKTPVRPEANANMGSCNETIDSANKGIDGIWELTASGRDGLCPVLSIWPRRSAALPTYQPHLLPKQ